MDVQYRNGVCLEPVPMPSMRCRELCPAGASWTRWRHGLCRSLSLFRLLADLQRPRRMARHGSTARQLDAAPRDSRSTSFVASRTGRSVARSTAHDGAPRSVEAAAPAEGRAWPSAAPRWPMRWLREPATPASGAATSPAQAGPHRPGRRIGAAQTSRWSRQTSIATSFALSPERSPQSEASL